MLPAPTVEIVKAECDAFDDENKLTEESLRQLRAQFPKNTDVPHVLLKVLVLNKLYSTRVNDVDVEPLARHIARLGIDSIITQGSLNAVDLITACPNVRRYYSFATKYCSWHNPTAYPIYDRYVDECLWSYKKQDHFATFHRQDLWYYGKLVEMVIAFRSHYGLDSLTFKQLDKFLWRSGERILRGMD